MPAVSVSKIVYSIRLTISVREQKFHANSDVENESSRERKFQWKVKFSFKVLGYKSYSYQNIYFGWKQRPLARFRLFIDDDVQWWWWWCKPKFHYADFATKSVTSAKFVTQIVSPIFMICVADFRDLCPRQSCVRNFHQNFMISWYVTVCVLDFHHDLCPRLSPRRSFDESRCNGICA